MRKIFKNAVTTLLTLSLMLSAVITAPASANDATNYEALVADRIARNTAFRQTLTDLGVKKFEIMDINKDGVDEMLITDTAYDYPSAIVGWVNGVAGYMTGAEEPLYGSPTTYYSEDTKYLLTVAGEIDGEIENWGKIVEGTITEIYVEEGYVFFGNTHFYSDGSGEWRIYSMTTGEDDLNTNKASIIALIKEKVPNMKPLILTKEVNDANLNQYLPIDEESVKNEIPTPEVTTTEKVTTTESATTASGNDTIVSVTDKNIVLEDTNDVLPTGTTMKSEKLTVGDVFEAAKEVVKNKLDSKEFVVYEFNLSDSNNTEIHELNNIVKVTIDAPFTVSEGKTIKVYRVDNGNLIECVTTYKDGKVTFETNHFSTYVFVEADITTTEESTAENTTVKENASETATTGNSNQNATSNTTVDNSNSDNPSTIFIIIGAILVVGIVVAVCIILKKKK